jgi:hypothetical protein
MTTSSFNNPPYEPRSAARATPAPQAEPNFKLNGFLAIVAVAADFMTGTIEFASMGALFFFSLWVASVLFVAGIIIQRKAGDPLSLAFAKSALVALLVAIPTPFPGFLVAAWGAGSSMKGRQDPNTIDMRDN